MIRHGCGAANASLNGREQDEQKGAAVLEVIRDVGPAAPSFPVEGVCDVPACMFEVYSDGGIYMGRVA